MKYRFIFYSLWTCLFIGLGWAVNRQEAAHFLAHLSLWYEPVMAGIVCGLLSGLLGLYMIWNRIVFVSLAIAQGAGFGIFLSFFIAGFWGISLEHSPISFLSGLVMALVTTFLFVSFRQTKKYSDEVVIGLVYVISSGLIVLMGDRIAEGKHAIDNLLFGNAVAVTPESLKLLSVMTAAIFAIHFLFRREFLYTSADTECMQVIGVKTKRWLGLLYLTLTLGITLSMKTLGSLPIFALMVIPPFISLKKAKNPREAVVISILLGGIIPPLGYYYSYLFSFPRGATIIGVGLLMTGISFLEKPVAGNR